MPNLTKRYQLDLTGVKPVIVETRKDTYNTYDVSSLSLSEDKSIIFIMGTCTERTLDGHVVSVKEIAEKDIKLAHLDIKGKAESAGLSAIYKYFDEIGQDYESDKMEEDASLAGDAHHHEG